MEVQDDSTDLRIVGKNNWKFSLLVSGDTENVEE